MFSQLLRYLGCPARPARPALAERLALASGSHFFIIFHFFIFAKVGFPDHRQIRVLELRECLSFFTFSFNSFISFSIFSFLQKFIFARLGTLRGGAWWLAAPHERPNPSTQILEIGIMINY